MIGICCDVMPCMLVNTEFTDDIITLTGRQDQAVFNRSSLQKLRVSFSPMRLTEPEILVRILLRCVSNIRMKRFWRYGKAHQKHVVSTCNGKTVPINNGLSKTFCAKEILYEI